MIELNGNENLIYSLLGLLIISLIVNLSYINKKLYDKIKHRHQKNHDLDVRSFLNDQIFETKNNDNLLLEKKVKSLRSAYLHIEKRGLSYKLNTDDHFRFVNQKVQSLYEIFRRVGNSNHIIEDIKKKIQIIKIYTNKLSDSQAKANIDKCLIKCEQACAQHSQHGAGLEKTNKSLTKVILRLTNTNSKLFNHRNKASETFIQNSKNALSDLEMISQLNSPTTTAKNRESLSEYDKNRSKIKKGVQRYKNLIQKAENEIDNVRENAALSPNRNTDSDQQKIADISDEIIEENSLEIDRLKKVINDQRTIIRDLEDYSLSNDGGNSEAHNKTREFLERDLKDAEFCIETLENELQSLRGSMKISESDLEPEKDREKNTTNLLNNTIEQMEQQLDSLSEEKDKDKIIIDFLYESADAMSIEDLSLLIFQTMSDLGYQTSLIFFAENRTIDVSSSKQLTKQRKIALINMQPGESNTSDGHRELNFRMRNFAGLISQNSYQKMSVKEQNQLFPLLSGVDRILHRLKTIQSAKNTEKKIGEFANTVKILISDIDEILDKDLKQLNTSVSTHFSRTNDLMKLKGANPAIISSIRNAELEIVNEIQTNLNPKKDIKRAALKALHNLE